MAPSLARETPKVRRLDGYVLALKAWFMESVAAAAGEASPQLAMTSRGLELLADDNSMGTIPLIRTTQWVGETVGWSKCNLCDILVHCLHMTCNRIYFELCYDLSQ